MVNVSFRIITLSYKSNMMDSLGLENPQLSILAQGNILAAIIFIVAYGIKTYYEEFSLGVGFGCTRKDFYLNVMIKNIMVACILAIIQVILITIDGYIISIMGYEPLIESILDMGNVGILANIIELPLIFLSITSIANIVGILQYRFSYKLWIGTGILILGIFSFVSQTTNKFIEKFVDIVMVEAISINGVVIAEEPIVAMDQDVIIIGILMISIVYFVGYLLMRKASVR